MKTRTDNRSRWAGRAYWVVALALSLASCSTEGPLTTPLGDDRSLQGAGPAIDVSGAWDWSRVEQLTLPAFVAEMFGIPVEGPVTLVRCESSGTMQLTQIGTSFEGPAERTTIACETKGGFAFVPPPAFSPPFFDVEDGTIRGRSIHFDFGGFPLPTPSHGMVSEVQNGLATALKATGRTIVPGHPLSPLPLNPPPAGTSKMIEWEAVRP